MTYNIKLSDFQKQHLDYYKGLLLENVFYYNKNELLSKFIGPIISLVNFDTKKFHYFGERNISAIINNYELHGRVDGMVASGVWNPKTPYFFITEYKKEIEPPNNPMAQNLVEMLVAQKQNSEKFPIYGLYIIGKQWTFMVLKDNTYAVTNPYIATTDDIYDIFKILKNLKNIIAKNVNKDVNQQGR